MKPYPFKQMTVSSHELNAVQAYFMEVALTVVDVLRDSPEQTAGVPSGVFAEEPHLVQPAVRLR